MENYKELKKYENSVEANIVKSFLEENEIDAIITDEFTGEIFGSVVKGVKLMIAIDQLEQARELLKSYEEGESTFDKDEE